MRGCEARHQGVRRKGQLPIFDLTLLSFSPSFLPPIESLLRIPQASPLAWVTRGKYASLSLRWS